ncbi:hypothetical protein CICLE_v100044533mg, partial [Citrus x clementina]
YVCWYLNQTQMERHE